MTGLPEYSMFGPSVPTRSFLDWLAVATNASDREYYRRRVCNWLQGADTLIARVEQETAALFDEYCAMKAWASMQRTAHARREAFDDVLAARYHQSKSRLPTVLAMRAEALAIRAIVGE